MVAPINTTTPTAAPVTTDPAAATQAPKVDGSKVATAAGQAGQAAAKGATQAIDDKGNPIFENPEADKSHKAGKREKTAADVMFAGAGIATAIGACLGPIGLIVGAIVGAVMALIGGILKATGASKQKKAAGMEQQHKAEQEAKAQAEAEKQAKLDSQKEQMLRAGQPTKAAEDSSPSALATLVEQNKAPAAAENINSSPAAQQTASTSSEAPASPAQEESKAAV